MADVARLARVSAATVSYVLNDTPGQRISEQTRQTVHRAARELGYRPNLSARNLARGGSGVVLFVVPEASLGDLPIELYTRLGRALHRHGMVSIPVFEAGADQAVVDAVAAYHPVAVTSMYPLTGAALAAVQAARIPHFHLGSDRPRTLHELHLAVGELWVTHLLARGHRRLGYAAGTDPRWRRLGDFWLAGLRAALDRRALPAPVVQQIAVPDAAATVTAWREAGVTAVCAQNDDTAFVVLHGLREAGLTCPADLAVAGVDTGTPAEVSAPPLTSIGFDLAAIVEISCATLLTAIGYPTRAAPAHAPAHLVPRRST